MIGSISEFTSSLTKSSWNPERRWEDVCYILVFEAGWTQKDIEESEIPFIFSILNARKRVQDEEERRLKKAQHGR